MKMTSDILMIIVGSFITIHELYILHSNITTMIVAATTILFTYVAAYNRGQEA